MLNTQDIFKIVGNEILTQEVVNLLNFYSDKVKVMETYKYDKLDYLFTFGEIKSSYDNVVITIKASETLDIDNLDELIESDVNLLVNVYKSLKTKEMEDIDELIFYKVLTNNMIKEESYIKFTLDLLQRS